MTVKELAERLSLKTLTSPDESREVLGCYAGDLLSWVMGRAKSDDAWVTIMTNVNIIAVAMLADVSCVIIAESAEIEKDVIEKASEKGINLYTSDKTVYQLCAEISKLV
jgi:serine kinase of HPr protein (carbohydrate metabolism regulator)